MRTAVLYPPEPVNNHHGDFERYIDFTTGNIAEFGVFEGGSTIQLAEYGRPVYAFDTFQGIPGEDFTGGLDHDLPGKFTPENNVLELLGKYPNVTPMIGRFADTLGPLASYVPDLKFGFVYLDADLYESYMQVFNFLFDGHLEDRFAIIADDYSTCKGATLAVDQLLFNHPELAWKKLSQGIVISNVKGFVNP